MIRYTLRCAARHDFDSWFLSSAGFDALQKAGQLACPVCGNSQIEKTLMAPAVRPARNASRPQNAPAPAEPQAPAPLSAPASPMEEAFAAMRRQVEENSDYVGLNFATEARAMHDGTMPERAIYGEAKPEDARQLIEDGVPVAPLPFMPRRKTN